MMTGRRTLSSLICALMPALMLGPFVITAAVAGPADMTPINAMRLNKLLDAS
jgi:hypothetical protein